MEKKKGGEHFSEKERKKGCVSINQRSQGVYLGKLIMDKPNVFLLEPYRFSCYTLVTSHMICCDVVYLKSAGFVEEPTLGLTCHQLGRI